MTFLTKNLRARDARRTLDDKVAHSRHVRVARNTRHSMRAGDRTRRRTVTRQSGTEAAAASAFSLPAVPYAAGGERQRPRSAGRAVRRQLRRCGASSLGKAARRLTHGGRATARSSGAPRSRQPLEARYPSQTTYVLVPSHVIATAVARTAVRLAKAKAEPTTRTAWPRTYSGVRLALLPVMKNSSAAGGRHGGLSRQPRSHRPARAAADRTRHRSRVPRCRGRPSRWRTRRDLTTATSQ